MEPVNPVPPANPEEWTDDQWIDWLKATDDEAASGRTAPPATPVGRITRSAGGQALGQAMLGLAEVIYGRNDEEIVIVVDGDSTSDTDGPFTVRLDPDHPERSSVVFRQVPDPPS